MVSVITRRGTSKDNSTELISNTVHLATHINASVEGAVPTQTYLEVKHHSTAVDFTLKFSTNVTSRRHGARSAGRHFRWQLSLHLGLPGLQDPLSLTALSHSFAYISRPSAQADPPPSLDTTPKVGLLLLDVVSDSRPGDLLTCVGRHLQHDHITAVLGQGDGAVATLPRVPQALKAGNADCNVSTFVTRVPAVAAGLYWVCLQSSEVGFDASTRLPLLVH